MKGRKYPWILLPSFNIAHTISSTHPERDFLGNPQYPKYNGKEAPPYFQLPNFLHHNKPSYLNFISTSTQNIYQILLQRERLNIRYSNWTEVFGQHNLVPNLSWASIWKNRLYTLDNNRKQNTLYKFLHNTFPTGQGLKSNNGRYATNCLTLFYMGGGENYPEPLNRA